VDMDLCLGEIVIAGIKIFHGTCLMEQWFLADLSIVYQMGCP
jgi:hypothetical protein